MAAMAVAHRGPLRFAAATEARGTQLGERTCTELPPRSLRNAVALARAARGQRPQFSRPVRGGLVLGPSPPRKGGEDLRLLRAGPLLHGPATPRALGRVQDDAILDDVAESVLETAERVALEAGAIIRRKLGRANEVAAKEVRCDLVTEVDRECEELIARSVQAAFPLHAVVGEETAGDAGLRVLEPGAMGPTDWAWIIDPIDGTLNFVGGIPFCAVSVGVARGGEVEVAAVYDPFANELFSARRGEGAHLNGRPLAGPPPPALELEDAAVAVGFPSLESDRAELVAALAAVAPHARTVRAFGSAALHMSYVAAGRLGCFFEPALKPWDIAAARLLVEESGGIVSSMEGSPVPLSGGSVVASRGGQALHGRVLALIQAARG